MALVSGTGTKYDFQGLRESLSDFIYDISPMDTPFMSAIGRGPKAKATLEEWQTDELAAVDASNAHLEGDDATFSTPSPSVRVGNYTQISRKTLILSDTLEEVDKAGRRSELAYQLSKRGKEIKRDQETIILSNQGGDAGGVGTARKLAGMGAWLKTNVDAAGDGDNPTYTSGVPSAGRTDGTQRAFTETILQNVHQACWESGANPSILLVGAYNKRAVSKFAGIATRNIDLANAAAQPMAVVAAVDVYVDDFGTLRVLPSRFQRARDAWLIDPEFAEIRYLRPHRKVKLAKTGDAEKRMLITEYTLVVKNEAAHGLAADLTTAAT